jgi:cytidylate kinase
MSFEPLVEKFAPYIASHGHFFKIPVMENPQKVRPAITISHQTGTGAHEIAVSLAQNLPVTEFNEKPTWRMLDQQMVEKTLEEHGSPKELARKISEDRRFFVHELVDDLLDLQPPSWVLMPQIVETITRLAKAGHVILVGHGATLVTASLPNVFHVRLTGSLDKRIERIQRLQNLTQDEAAKLVRNEDRGRQKYIKAFFHSRLDNELLYDLVINTDRISDADVVGLIAEGFQRVFTGSKI